MTDLPDEIIEQICSYVPPVELCLAGWEVVSSGFRRMLQEMYSKNAVWDTVCGPNQQFFEQFHLPQAEKNEILARQLDIIIRKIFPHVTTLTISAATFCAVLRHIELHEPILLLPKLRSLHVLLGDNFGVLTTEHTFSDFTVARSFAVELKSVEISVTLSENSENFLACNFRELLRFLMEITGNAGTWSLYLKDKTARAQGWFCPSELSYYRSIAFISYVRIALELGLTLHTLQLVDELKMSPYMMIMQKRHRFLYMYDEYKQCCNLIICYDIGIVAPSFLEGGEEYPLLQRVEIVASHVLSKNDFLKYLAEAPNIAILRISLPYRWTERVKRCRYGCFRNSDFSCFMEYGWASLPFYLPHASLIFYQQSIF